MFSPLLIDLENNILQKIIRRINHPPTDEGPHAVQLHALVKGS